MMWQLMSRAPLLLSVVLYAVRGDPVAGIETTGKDEFEPVEDVTEQKDQRIGAIDHILDPFWDLPDDDNEVDGGGTPADVECGKLEPTGKPPLTAAQYMKIRNAALDEEDKFRLGGSLTLNKEERKVNEILMWYKRKEFEQGLERNGDRILFPAGMHFYHIQKYIDRSNVYKLIKLMPKGGVLHLHDLQSGSMEFAVELTKKFPTMLYLCWDANSVLRFQFFVVPTVADFCVTDWVLVSEFRKNSSSEQFIDDIFLKKMRLVSDTPEVDYPDNNAAWRIFLNTIITTGGLLGFDKATELYFYNLLQQFYDDNCQYIEVRSLLEFFYRINESNPSLTDQEVLQLFKDVTDKFVKDHPDFWGARIIYSPRRTISMDQMAVKISDAIRLKKLYPEFLAGFDMAFHEDFVDVAHTLEFYRRELLNASAIGLKFFFHAGETDWHGTRIDDNLLDAVLLNATRIGHGTALNARPYLVDRIREKGIGVEVNPISSQVLKLSSADMRTHPTIPFVREGFPMVISCDDAGSLGTNNLSYDWYVTFMAMAGERADLRFLKQLAMNSIKYSAMCEAEKQRNMKRWRRKWNQFLKRAVIEFPISKLTG